jgi:hypothetical protein
MILPIAVAKECYTHWNDASSRNTQPALVFMVSSAIEWAYSRKT